MAINDCHRRYATVANAAEYAACSESTVRRWMTSGQLTFFRNGRIIRVDLNEIDKLLTPKWVKHNA